MHSLRSRGAGPLPPWGPHPWNTENHATQKASKGGGWGLSCHSQAAPDILTEQKTEPSPGSHIPTRVLLLLLWGRGDITF